MCTGAISAICGARKRDRYVLGCPRRIGLGEFPLRCSGGQTVERSRVPPRTKPSCVAPATQLETPLQRCFVRSEVALERGLGRSRETNLDSDCQSTRKYGSPDTVVL